MIRAAGHLALVLALTALTQLGGIAWALALMFRRRLLAFGLFYGLIWAAAFVLAPMAGRVPLPCFGEALRMQSPAYCLMMRHYVVPEMANLAHDTAQRMTTGYPDAMTLALDAGFPFLDGMPLLPHLSHHDGRKLDLAFYYMDRQGTYLPGKTRSPIGYWAFEEDRSGADPCPPALLTMRWNMGWLQPLWPDRPIEGRRSAALAQALLDDPRLGRMFLEPHLAKSFGLSDPRVRFQGCRAARHDDHIHIQL